MSEAIIVTDMVRIPPSALTVHAVRVSGPGGQELAAVEGLSDGACARLHVLARHRHDADGRLMVTSQALRYQARNPEDRAKVADFVRAALVPPQRRLTGRKRRAAVRRWRLRPGEND